MSILPRKTHMLWVENEPQVCVWCKKPCGVTELTLEHVNGKEIKPDLRIIKLACKKCNSIHGSVIDLLAQILIGQLQEKVYRKNLRKLSDRQNYHGIISNSWFQVSLDRFRHYPKFRHYNPTYYNPFNISANYSSFVKMLNIDYVKPPAQKIADHFFSRIAKTKDFLWRLNYALHV